MLGASLVFVSGLPLVALIVVICMYGDPVDREALAQARSDGAVLIRAIKEYRAVHASLPPNIGVLDIELGSLPYKGWEYRSDPENDSFWLQAGSFDDGFRVSCTTDGVRVTYDS